jgi:2-keto-3-deoxy-L-rhamnonate aldolase RhmA
VIDRRHGRWNRPTLKAAIGFVPAEVPVLVGNNTLLAIGQVLDACAEGVILPPVTMAEAARCAEGYGLAIAGIDIAILAGGFAAGFAVYIDQSYQLSACFWPTLRADG